jgi:hypothetical protein
MGVQNSRVLKMWKPEGKQKLLHIDSRDMTGGTLDHFRVTLSESLKDVVALSLQSVELEAITGGNPNYVFLELGNVNTNNLVASNTSDTRYFAKIPLIDGTNFFYTVNDNFENVRFTDPQSFQYLQVDLYTYNRTAALPTAAWSFTLLVEMASVQQKKDPFTQLF